MALSTPAARKTTLETSKARVSDARRFENRRYERRSAKTRQRDFFSLRYTYVCLEVHGFFIFYLWCFSVELILNRIFADTSITSIFPLFCEWLIGRFRRLPFTERITKCMKLVLYHIDIPKYLIIMIIYNNLNKTGGTNTVYNNKS